MEPTNTQVLIVICDHGVEDDAVFSTEDFDFRGGRGWREKKKNAGDYLHSMEGKIK